MLATVLSALIVDYFYIEPVGSFAIQGSVDLLALMFFLLCCALIISITEVLRRTRARVIKAEMEAKLAHDRERAEQELHRAAVFNEAAMRSLGEGLYTIDDKGLLTFMNPAAEELLGWTFEELRGTKMHDVTHYRHRDGRPFPSSECVGFQVLTHVVPLKNCEDVFIHRNGTFFDVIYSIAPMSDATGKITGLVIVFSDITERKRAEERLRADLSALTRMHELSKRLLGAGGLQSLLQDIMDTAVAIVGAEKGTLQLLEEGSLRIVAHCGHQEPFLKFFAAAENTVSVCGEATKCGERVVVQDIEKSSLFVGTPSLMVMLEAGVRSVQSTPIMSRTGTLLGILTTQWNVPYSLSERDVWRIDLLVRQAADMIEQTKAEGALRKSNDELERRVEDRTKALRDLASHLQSIREEERAGFARDIHDELGQSLIALKMELAWFRRKYKDDSLISERTRSMLHFTDTTISSVKRICTELRPSMLDDLGLVSAIEWLAEEFEKRTGIQCSVIKAARGIELEIERSIALYRIVQEALTNAAKHSEATKITIRMVRDDDSIKLEISDNGKGITDEELLKVQSFGLIGMRERVFTFNGGIDISGGEGKGTTVRVNIPVQ